MRHMVAANACDAASYMSSSWLYGSSSGELACVLPVILETTSEEFIALNECTYGGLI